MPRKANSDDETLRQLNAMVSHIPTGKDFRKWVHAEQKKAAKKREPQQSKPATKSARSATQPQLTLWDDA